MGNIKLITFLVVCLLPICFSQSDSSELTCDSDLRNRVKSAYQQLRGHLFATDADSLCASRCSWLLLLAPTADTERMDSECLCESDFIRFVDRFLSSSFKGKVPDLSLFHQHQNASYLEVLVRGFATGLGSDAFPALCEKRDCSLDLLEILRIFISENYLRPVSLTAEDIQAVMRQPACLIAGVAPQKRTFDSLYELLVNYIALFADAERRSYLLDCEYPRICLLRYDVELPWRADPRTKVCSLAIPGTNFTPEWFAYNLETSTSYQQFQKGSSAYIHSGFKARAYEVSRSEAWTSFLDDPTCALKILIGHSLGAAAAHILSALNSDRLDAALLFALPNTISPNSGKFSLPLTISLAHSGDIIRVLPPTLVPIQSKDNNFFQIVDGFPVSPAPAASTNLPTFLSLFYDFPAQELFAQARSLEEFHSMDQYTYTALQLQLEAHQQGHELWLMKETCRIFNGIIEHASIQYRHDTENDSFSDLCQRVGFYSLPVTEHN